MPNLDFDLTGGDPAFKVVDRPYMWFTPNQVLEFSTPVCRFIKNQWYRKYSKNRNFIFNFVGFRKTKAFGTWCILFLNTAS